MQKKDAKIAIVTGGSAGLGAVMTLALLDAGHSVAAVGRTQALLEELRARASQAGTAERLLLAVGDITSPGECMNVVRRTIERFGAVDALVNNAGVNIPADVRSNDPKFWKVKPEVWRDLIDTNVNGAFFMAHAVVPFLIGRGWGRIVNHVTSLRTMIRPGDTPYGPSKAALEAMTTAWAGELSGTGVTVNAIMPGGAADTRMIPSELGIDRSLLVKPAVMGPPICWLLSEESDGFSGHRITADAWDPDVPLDINIARATVETGWKPLPATAGAPSTTWPPSRSND